MGRNAPVDGSSRMYELVSALGDQLRDSAGLPGLDEVRAPERSFGRIILCGMGGSAIAGDLVQPLLRPGGIQLHVWRDYGLPAWAAPEDLVICSSYSGNTEESLSGAREAGRLGCARLAVTSGGELAAMATTSTRCCVS